MTCEFSIFLLFCRCSHLFVRLPTRMTHTQTSLHFVSVQKHSSWLSSRFPSLHRRMRFLSFVLHFNQDHNLTVVSLKSFSIHSYTSFLLIHNKLAYVLFRHPTDRPHHLVRSFFFFNPFLRLIFARTIASSVLIQIFSFTRIDVCQQIDVCFGHFRFHLILRFLVATKQRVYWDELMQQYSHSKNHDLKSNKCN